MSEEKYGAGQQQLALLQAALEAESNMNPPIWIIGSGMVLNANGKGIPSTKDFADRYLEAFKKLPVDEIQLKKIESLQKRLEKDDTVAVYQEASDLFFPVPNKDQSDLERSWNEKVRKKHIETIRSLVLKAWDGTPQAVDQPKDLERLVKTSSTNNFWNVRPGLKSLAKILIHHPGEKNHAIFTTNFDPLISVALIREGCAHTRVTFEDEDYPITRVYADVPVVYHVHGYWTGRTTLNTGAQFAKSKQGQFMKQSMMQLFHDRQVIVLGYGGWDDILMAALNDSNASICWCYRKGTQPPTAIKLSQAVNIEVSDIDKVLEFLAEYTYKQANPSSREAAKMKDENEALRKEKNTIEEMLKVRNDHKTTLENISNDIKEIKNSYSTIDKNIPQVSTALNSLTKLLDGFRDETIVEFNNNVLEFRKGFEGHRISQREKLNEIESISKSIKSLVDNLTALTGNNKTEFDKQLTEINEKQLAISQQIIHSASNDSKAVVKSILAGVNSVKDYIISNTDIDTPSLQKISLSVNSISDEQKVVKKNVESILGLQTHVKKSIGWHLLAVSLLIVLVLIASDRLFKII